SGNFAVTAEDASGNTDTNYTGTVHFTSSDSKASLPADYTFTTSPLGAPIPLFDNGTHTFSGTLYTAGTQSITARDTANATLAGTDGAILVNAAAGSQLRLSYPPYVCGGTPFSV